MLPRRFVSVAGDGELLPEVREAISVIANTPTRDGNGHLVLATGHNSPDEVLLIVREAQRVGVKGIIVTHPLLSSVGMNHDQMREAARLGAYLEFTLQFGGQTPEQPDSEETEASRWRRHRHRGAVVGIPHAALVAVLRLDCSRSA